MNQLTHVQFNITKKELLRALDFASRRGESAFCTITIRHTPGSILGTTEVGVIGGTFEDITEVESA